MIGAYLNGFGILLGALAGLIILKPLTVQAQSFFKFALGALIVIYGLWLIHENVQGPFFTGLKQIFIACLAIVLGNWLGRLLGLQTLSNRIGHHAATLLAAAQKNPPGAPSDGLMAATMLFCAAPLGILGAVVDGLQNFFYLLLLKAVMDGLAMMSFVKLFRWPVALAAIPVFLFLDGLAVLVQLGAKPWLETTGLAGYVGITAGLMACSVSVVIFEVRRVELANYLPALALAPVLAHWLA